MDRRQSQLFFIVVFLVLFIVSFLIIKPFLISLLTGIVFAYIFYPFYRFFATRIKSNNVAAFLASFIAIVLLIGILFFVVNTISQEAYSMYIFSKQVLAQGNVLAADCASQEGGVCQLQQYLAAQTKDPQIKYYIDSTLESVTSKITEWGSSFLFSIPKFMLQAFIVLFVMFFLFRDGKLLVYRIERLLPMKASHQRRVITRLDGMASAVIYGSIIVAIIQGALGGIGFAVVQLPSPLLWGIVMAFASLVPFVGSSVIWLPASLLLLVNGLLTGETQTLLFGAGLLAYGALVVSLIDNILKPKIIGSKGGLHPVLVLLGVVGGLSLFGFIGVIVGPIILALLITFITIYEEEVKEEHETNH